jgi:phosphate transport system permease protein
VNAFTNFVRQFLPGYFSVNDWRFRELRERAAEKTLLAIALASGAAALLVLVFILKEAWPTWRHNGLGFLTRTGWDQQIVAAWTAPAGQPVWEFGALPLVAGTVYTTIGALALCLPAGVGCAIFLAEICPRQLRELFQSVVRLLAAIPSVIYGLVGLMVVVPWVRQTFITDELALKMIRICPLDGTGLLPGIVVLAAMIGPIFIALATDALRSVPHSYKEAALALGLSHWRAITLVMLPAAWKGILAGAILAAAKAMGEAVAMAMVTGSVAHLPSLRHGWVFFLEPLRTLPAAIIDNAEGMTVPSIQSALFACASVLLVSCACLSFFSRLVTGLAYEGGVERG